MVSKSSDKAARTWTEFLQRVRDARHDLGNPSPVWFRGQGKASYDLVPSLIRHEKGVDREQALFNEYERSAAHLNEEKSESDWDMLNDMQHYGIPTRLLDWTDVLGIAVAFALYDDTNDNVASAIYVLNPTGLNRLSGINGIKRPRNDPDFAYKAVYWHGRPISPIYPIAIDGRLRNPRLRAQSGSFTVHGIHREPLEQVTPSVVRKVVLTPEAKPEAREFLEHANLNAFSIYPDIVGMARYIVRKHLGA